MEEWKEYIVSDLGRIVTGKTPRTSIPENYGGKIPFLTPSDDLSGKYSPKTIKTITDTGLEEVKNCLLPSKSICVSCIGSDLGKVVITKEPTVTNQQFNSIIPNDKNDADYIYYLMTIVGKQLNYLSKTSTAVPIVNKSTFSSFRVKLPSKKIQHRIASILKSLDDKIEVNRKINENLEQQAQALFKSWFVDFEPFKNGEFVESELEMIPKGWRVGTLKEIADIIMGTSPSGSSYNTEGIGDVFYQGRAEFSFRFPKRNMYTTEAKRFAEVDTVLVSVRAPVGDINVAEERCCIGRGLASVKSKKNYNSYILYLMQSLKNVFDRFNGEGTVFGSINKKAFEEMQIIVPTGNVISKFDSIASSMDCQIKRTEQESRSLAELRDTLLPKLMSGELRVPDTDLINEMLEKGIR